MQSAFLIDLAGSIFLKRWPFMLMAIFLFVALMYMFRKRFSVSGRAFRLIAYGVVLLFGIRVFALAAAQYSLWSTTTPGQFFLPPYQPISYFFQYCFTHYAASTLLTFALALGIASMLSMVRRYRRGMLQEEDIPLFFSIMMLIRWPLSFAYIWAVLFGGVAVVLVRRLLRQEPNLTLSPQLLVWGAPFLLWGRELIIALHLRVLIMPG